MPLPQQAPQAPGRAQPSREGWKENSRALAIGPLLSCSSVAWRTCSWSSCRTRSVSDQVSPSGAQHLFVRSDQVRRKEHPFHHEGSALCGARGPGAQALPSVTSEAAPLLHICTGPHRAWALSHDGYVNRARNCWI